MRHRRKKRNDDVKRSTNVVVRAWRWIVNLFKEYDEVQKELADMGIFYNFTSLGGGFFSHFDAKAEKLEEHVPPRSRKRGQRSND